MRPLGNRERQNIMQQASRTARWSLAAGLVALCVVIRVAAYEGWLPIPPNAAPVAGAGLVAGILFGSWTFAALVPLTAMTISDLFIGGYATGVMITVYVALLLPVLLSSLVRRYPSALSLCGAAVASSLSFFCATNFAVWAFGGWYERSAAGLIECFVAALPFLKYTVVGDQVWTLLLFGLAALAARGSTQRSLTSLLPAKRLAPVHVEERR